MANRDYQLIAELSILIQAIQGILNLNEEKHDFAKSHADFKALLQNFNHMDLSLDFYNTASETVKHITKLRHAHPNKKHIFIHLDNIVELLKHLTYRHPLLKKHKFIKTRFNSTKEHLKKQIAHAKEIIEAAEKAYAETTRMLRSLQQQCELQNVTPEFAARIKLAATKMHLINMAATIAADKITSLNKV